LLISQRSSRSCHLYSIEEKMNYDTPQNPGDTQRAPRALVMRWPLNGQVTFEVHERDITLKADGTYIAQDLGTLPTPYDPAELVAVPGVGTVPAGAIVGAVEAWIRAKQIARDAE
jgi:hypothetical protein